MKKIYVYIIGVMILGVLYSEIKSLLSYPPFFFSVVVVYLIALRFISEKFGK